MGSCGELTAVLVGEPQTSPTDLPPEEAILFDQVGECLPLPAIEPAGDGDEQQPKNGDVDHERQVISRTAFTTTKGGDPTVGQFGPLRGAPPSSPGHRGHCRPHGIAGVGQAELTRYLLFPATSTRADPA